jgi:hypothetical protein
MRKGANMKKSNILFIVSVMGVLAFGMVVVLMLRKEPAHKAAASQIILANHQAPQPTVSNSKLKESPTQLVTNTPPEEFIARSPKLKIKTNVPHDKETINGQQPIVYNGYKIKDPMARVALYLVGSGDQDANAYWENAIFDPSLPSEERKDLIEDLNETGLATPKHPGPEDLPVILARLRLIEQIAPYSIDQVDADAFAEAYKDLVGMAQGQAPQ